MTKYRKLNRESRIRRSILAGLTKDVINNGYVVTTEARAKEARKFVDRMITYGKDGSLVARRKALAFLHNDKDVVSKVFNELAPKYQDRMPRQGCCWSRSHTPFGVDQLHRLFRKGVRSVKTGSKAVDGVSFFQAYRDLR